MAGRHIMRQTDASLRELGISTGYRMDILDSVKNYSVTETGNADQNLSNNSSNLISMSSEVNEGNDNQASGALITEIEQGSNTQTCSSTNTQTSSSANTQTSSSANTQTCSSNDASQMLLLSDSDPDFVSALNAPSRVNRILEKSYNELYVKYNVQSIIEKGNGGQEIISLLDRNGYVSGSQRLRLVNILMTHLLNNVADPALVSTNMREAMAICLVFRWRTLCSVMYKKEDRPWYDWYNPVHNMGALNHQLQTAHRALKKKGKGIRKPEARAKRPRVLKELPCNTMSDAVDDPDPEDYAQDTNELKFMDASSLNKATVLSLMSRTFGRRREYMAVKTLITTSEVVEKFPKFLSYHGDVLDQEFDLLFPGKGKNFIRNFTTEFVPRILKIAENEQDKFSNCSSFCDDTLNATVILGKILPTPRRTFAHEEKMPLHPGLPDFFRMIPLGSNPQEEAAKHRQEAGYPIQPHIMAVGHPKAMGTMYLVVGDGKIIELHRTATPTKAIDLLFKTYHALNIHYPLGWKNVLRFIAVHIFYIPPEGKRESQFQEQLRRIKNTSL
ncbi:Efflux pump himE [Frankliniella fusca]|uniref:Efflux pump himE n=1 Tax=Frankliniella fusca TaxID=407009 RepID=A0AAE1LJC5_9NEOP|nr:Efflux pump himE [Frankliniella fusca]